MAIEGIIPRPRGMRFFRRAALACAAFVVCACGIHTHDGGTGGTCGTEVPDGDEIVVRGCVERGDGGPAIGVRVRAVAKSDFSTADSVSTDSTGLFYFTDTLPEGSYNLVFEDANGVASGSFVPNVVRLPKGRTVILPRPVVMASTKVLTLKLINAYSSLELQGSCKLQGTPYHEETNSEGEIHLQLPLGVYTVICIENSVQATDTEIVDFKGENEPTLIPFRDKVDLGEQPASLSAAYDSNTGVASLHWSKVKAVDVYGVRRIEPAAGVTRQAVYVPDTAMTEAAYGPGDSAQERVFIYQVYSAKSLTRFPVNLGPADTVRATRPSIFGPRIDSLVLLKPDSAGAGGDTVRVEAAWRNLVRENDTLYWQVKGHPEIQSGRAHPAASGKDTLAFPLTSAGGFEISITLVDAQGYRSWYSKFFPFYGKP